MWLSLISKGRGALGLYRLSAADHMIDLPCTHIHVLLSQMLICTSTRVRSPPPHDGVCSHARTLTRTVRHSTHARPHAHARAHSVCTPAEWQIRNPHIWCIPGVVSGLYDYIQRSTWTTNSGFAEFMYYSPVASALGQMASCGWFPEGDKKG